MNSTFCALKKVHRSKQTFFGQTSIEKQPAICSEHFAVGLFAMKNSTSQKSSSV